MIHAYELAGARVHLLEADAELPYQIFARASSVMSPWGAIIMLLQKPYRRGEIAEVLRFSLRNDIPIHDIVTAGNVEGAVFMVLKPGVAICGYSGQRSIRPAVERIASWFEAEVREFHRYAFDRHFLHLDVKTGMLAES